MLEIIRCCRCNEAVRPPESVNTIWVRCPHCCAEYPLDQVTTQTPPALEAIYPPSVSTLADVDSDASAEPKRGELLVSSVSRSIGIDEQEPNRIRSPRQLHADRKKVPPRRKKSASFGASFAKVALGGVTGLFIGQLILWWLPDDVRSDPMELAPKLPPAVAFLAPESLRNPDSLLIDSRPDSVSDRDTDTALLASDATSNTVTTQIPPGNSLESSEVVIGLANAPKIRMPELWKSLREAESANARLAEGETWTNESIAAWYRSLSELAYCVTFGDMSEPNITQFASYAKNFLHVIASDSRKTAAIGTTAAVKINSAANHRKGILVTGKVDRILPAGDLYQTDLTLNGSSASVSVLSRIDPRETHTYKMDDEVLILGVIITDPSLYLLGYRGTAEPVVLGGLPIKTD